MRIFIAVHHYPPSHTGGAELRAHRTARALQQRGHTLQAFAIEKITEGPRDGIAWDDEVYEGIPLRRIRFDHKATPDRFVFSYQNAWIGDHLKQFLGEVKPDIYHLFGGYLQTGSSIQAAADLGIPTMLSLTDYWFMCPRIQLICSDYRICEISLDPLHCLQCYSEEKRRYRWPGRLFPGLMKAYWKSNRKGIIRFSQRKDYLISVLNQVDAIIAPSRFIGEVYIKGGVNPEKVIFARQGRTFSKLTKDILEKSLSPTLRLAYIGQLAEIKGVHVLLEAVRLLPDTHISVKLYGDLDNFPKYVKKLRQIAGHDERVRFMGVFKQEQVSDVFHVLDAVVVPSLWYENSPNVILEAFAHRTPVLTSNLGAMPELVIDGKNGLLFQPGDAKSLAEKIKGLLEDRGLLPKLVAGIEPVKTEEQELEELEGIYQKILAARAK